MSLDCPSCRGTGFVSVDWGNAPCPRCRLDEADRIRAAAEDRVEGLYRDQYGPDFDKLAVYGVEGR
jgi:hypothetical protein